MNKNFDEKMIKDLRHFFKNVMMRLGHHGWTLNLKEGHDSYCWRSQKRIDVGMDYGGDLKYMILHEIAHIDTAKYCNQSHNPQFWKQFEYLVRKFWKTTFDEKQYCLSVLRLSWTKWHGKEYYGLVYSEKHRERILQNFKKE